MRRSIFLKLMLISVISVLICSIVSAVLMQRRYEQQIEDGILAQLNTLVQADSSKDADKLSSYLSGYRVTVIDADGEVISDSQAEELDNHLTRPEIAQALDTGKGTSKRYSNTLNQDMFYAAIDYNGTIYRAAVPISGLQNSFTRQVPAILIGLVLSLLVSGLLAGQIAKSTLVPLEALNQELQSIKDGEYDTELPVSKYDEITSMVTGINTLASQIATSIEQIELEKEKSSFVLDNMQQGLIVIDKESKIINCNKMANSLFQNQTDVIDKPLIFLTHNNQIVDSAIKCLENKSNTIFDLFLEEYQKTYAVSISYISNSWLEGGCILLLTDVTQERQAETLRKEFVANASHELKTPITSIRGFSELLSNNLVSDENKKKEILESIQEQAEEMAFNIDKIMTLSKLDENNRPSEILSIPVLGESEKILAGMKPQIDDKHLRVKILGDRGATVKMNSEHFHQLMSNLLSNAVKYNKEGGALSVCATNEGNKCVIAVQDTGIGIPAKDLDRVFERFYRGDTPTMVEGSGLGLAIVKHIVHNYHGDIQIDSIPNEGTKIVVTI